MNKRIYPERTTIKPDDVKIACFNTKETAKYIGLGISKTQEYIREGIIPSIKLGRRYLISKVALDKWLENGGIL